MRQNESARVELIRTMSSTQAIRLGHIGFYSIRKAMHLQSDGFLAQSGQYEFWQSNYHTQRGTLSIEERYSEKSPTP